MGEKKSTRAIINLVLFSGIAVSCASKGGYGWILALALAGAAYNLWAWLRLLQVDSKETDDDDRRLLMKELEEEAERRRKQERVKRN